MAQFESPACFDSVGHGRMSREELGTRVVTKYLIDRRGILYAYLFIILNKYSQ